jgi:hypothetical protein
MKMAMSSISRNNGRLGETAQDLPNGLTHIVKDHKVITIKEAVVHSFEMGDVEDPDLYAAEPLLKWQNSESGSWVMSHALEPPTWHRIIDHMTYGYKYAITAKLSAVDYTFWCLKWANSIDKR